MSFGETEPGEFHGGGTVTTVPPGNRVTFDRRELNRILGLYGRMVAAGEWRDYAIDFLATGPCSRCSAAPRKYRSTASKNPNWRAARRLQRGVRDRPDRPSRPRA